MSRPGVVIVGTSIAAATAATTLRSEGYDGAVTLLGEEPHPPYARPPLSKSVLAGPDSPDSGHLALLDLGVAVRSGTRAIALDTGRRRVAMAGGETVPYDKLVIATGARARTLSGDNAPHEWVLRSLDDACRLAAALDGGPSVLIIGGGVLGFEVASTCRARGLDVTVVDAGPPLVARLGEDLAGLVVESARDAGVRVVVSRSGVRRHAAAGRVVAELGDGTRFDADVVLTSVGCQPNVEWLAGSGIELSGGLVVDDRCRVGPGIVAAGDVTRVRGPDGTTGTRTPNWTDAINQARTAAGALLRGDDAPLYVRDPYFWTEGCGLSVKVAGRLPASGVPRLVAGHSDGGRLLQWVQHGQPVTAAAINYRIPIAKLKQLSRAPVG